MRNLLRHLSGPHLLAVLLAVSSTAGCFVNFDDDALYICADDSDCAGDGYKCVYGSSSGYCCKLSPGLDLQTDPANCGKCGVQCAGACVAGQCTDGGAHGSP